MPMMFELPGDLFPILTKIHAAKDLGGEEAVEAMLSLLSPGEREQLNKEVSMLVSGTFWDPFVDYIRMRHYEEN
jgi:hypothetical protein